jgi:hypothetical protein
MYAIVESVNRFGESVQLIKINPRTIELALELAAEGADEETIDEFLDNDDNYALSEMLIAIMQGEFILANGTYFIGEEVIIGIGDTPNAAKIAFVDARMSVDI